MPPEIPVEARHGEALVWTDGACRGNPGPGCWAAIVVPPGGAAPVELHGGEPHTTNNRMELKGVIEGLKALTRPCRVRVQCDSAYVVNAHRKGWIRNWQRNGWRTAAKKPVENQDLWIELLAAEQPHEITWELVKGHAGHELNERADVLAVQARERAAQASLSSRG
jgi:ribonuclease HI